MTTLILMGEIALFVLAVYSLVNFIRICKPLEKALLIYIEKNKKKENQNL